MAFGEFESRPSYTPMADINVTPLVDVMLVLLVIFIIAAPMMTGALHMELPQVDVAAASDKPAPLEIAIEADGQVSVDGQALPMAQLAAALSLRAQAQSAQANEVQLKIDKTVPYGRVAEAMAEIQKSEMRSVSLAVQPARPKIDTTAPAPRN
jgi:biopolymer transport protein TolR